MNDGYKEDQASDTELWCSLKEGDRKALKILFERHYNDLYQYAFKLSNDSFLAKDCVQELFFRIWDRRAYLSDITSVKAYLWVALRRDIFKTINSASIEVQHDNLISYPDLLTFTYEDFIIHEEKKKEQKEALVRALNKLPDRHREAIFLKYFNGMGYQEIQKIMSVNYQTARNYVYHGVRRLKNEFQDRIYTPSKRAVM